MSCSYRTNTRIYRQHLSKEPQEILNFNALCPTKWKSGLILCFLNRAKPICSSDFLFDKEVSMLKKMFLNNGYPSSFFDKILASFQSSNKFSRNISFENNFCILNLGKESYHFQIVFLH